MPKIEVKIITNFFFLNGQKITLSEFQKLKKEGKIPPGEYEKETPGVGRSKIMVRPSLDPKDLDKLNKAINLLFELDLENEKSVKELKEFIEQDIYIQWCLVDALYRKKDKLKEFFSKLQPRLAFIKDNCPIHYLHLFANNASSIDDLQLFIDLFGKEILQQEYLGEPILFRLVDGNITDEASLEKLRFCLKHGANINAKAPQFGTLLHINLANEITALVLYLLQNSQEFKFDYEIQDGEGKTPLLLAAKTRQEKVVIEFTKLHKQGKKIGIDIPDNEGRTPLMILAALGCADAFLALLKVGAKLTTKDKQGRTLEDYISLPPSEVIELLKSIHIEPERDIEAPHNWLYNNDAYANPLAYVNEKGEEELILISKEPIRWQRILEVCQIVKENPALHEDIQRQIEPLATRKKNTKSNTILAISLQGQAEVKENFEFYRKQKEKELRIACVLGNIEDVKKLLEQGIDINVQDEHQRTPLHFAVMRTLLIKENLKNPNDETIQKCLQQHPAIVELLLQKGANMKIQNINKLTAKDIAERDSKDPTRSQAEKEVAKKCCDIFEGFENPQEEIKEEQKESTHYSQSQP